tara:strand:+ start:165 stop:488 length:324 start_codon:yes stop_codon:yes gene_type:complete
MVVIGYLIIISTQGGLNMLIEYEKYNWYLDLLFLIILIIITQLLCNFKLKILAWTLCGLLVIFNIYVFLFRKLIVKLDTKLVNLEKNDNLSFNEALKKITQNNNNTK